MLSKKMTVSLMSLITIIALAFVTTSAFAQVKVTLSGRTSAPHGGTAASPTATTVDVVIETDKNANMPTLEAVVFDKDGNTVDQATNAVTFVLNAAMENTAKKRYITVTVPSELNGDNTATDGGVNLPLRVVVTIPAIEPSDPSDDTADSKVMYRAITITRIMDTTGLPKVVSIQRLRPGSQTVVAAFQEEIVTDTSFDVRFVLTEAHSEYDGGKTADENAKRLIEVEGGVPSNLVVGVPFARSFAGTDTGNTIRPHPTEGMYEYADSVAPTLGLSTLPSGTIIDDIVPLPTGADEMYRQYRVTITPHSRKGDKTKTFPVKIKVKNFHDGGAVRRETYVSPGFGDSTYLPNGREILTVNVAYTEVNLKAGYRVTIPKEKYIPGGGYLIIARNKAGSEVDTTGQDADRIKDAPRPTFRTPAQLKYNVFEAALPNLATQFLNGVVVDVESGNKLYITEVMWGEDVSLNPSSNSQYIELYNPGGGFNTPDDDASTPNVDERLTLVFYAPNEFDDVPEATGRVVDRIGTLDAKGAYWSPASKGQSGRSGTGEAESLAGRTTPVAVPIVSMYRGMVPDTSTGAAADAMMPADGQMAASWMSSEGPKSANFDPTALGIRHGTPGAATDATETPADTEAEAKAKADAAAAAAKKAESTGTVPQDGQIYISEVMFAGGGTLPQWIEISNGSRTEEVNLSGWTLTVNNAVADADVSVGASIKFTIPAGTKIMPSAQNEKPSTLLVVTEAGRNNIPAASGQVLNLWEAGQTELILAGVTKRRYSLLSDMAFEIVLAPPAPTATKLAATATAAQKADAKAADASAMLAHTAATDTVGNLGADNAATWALPMSEDGGRSSIIRRHIQVSIGPAEPEDGAMMESWALASETSFAQVTHVRVSSYYGAANDVGTPGFRAGGALPVELSHFRPARDDAGAVVITWSTQSELNNAGFFIKRSQQRDGEFKVINATMVAGAGTTSEKQSYTYTDTTAQPNVVYYYQIEDVSLDGQRQTLTHGIRLKGHIGAAGKLTSTWGELKSSNE